MSTAYAHGHSFNQVAILVYQQKRRRKQAVFCIVYDTQVCLKPGLIRHVVRLIESDIHARSTDPTKEAACPHRYHEPRSSYEVHLDLAMAGLRAGTCNDASTPSGAA